MEKPIKRASVQLVSPSQMEVRVNASAMSLLHTCERKAKFVLFDSVESPGSTAMDFGKMIHKALERYYLQTPDLHKEDVLVALWDEVTANYEDSENGIHTKAVGRKVLANYAKMYQNDPWVAVRDYSGLPLAETGFEFRFHQNQSVALSVDYLLFGTIDLIVQNSQTGEYAVMDHKTGRSLGKEFINRWKPNNQVSAYLYALNQHYGFEGNKFIVNGLQIAKTVQSTLRVETHRDADELAEFKDLALRAGQRLEAIHQGDFAAPADGMTCSQFSGCSFLGVCALSPKLRETALKNMTNNQVVEMDDL